MPHKSTKGIGRKGHAAFRRKMHKMKGESRPRKQKIAIAFSAAREASGKKRRT